MSKAIFHQKTITVMGLSILLSSCISEQVEPKIDCPEFQISVDQLVDTSCGESNGSFIVDIQGGTSPYRFETGSLSNETGSFSNLASGVYDVSITDANGCVGSIRANIDNEDGTNIDNVAVNDAGCGSTQGSITVTASGGQEPYSYSLNGGASQTSNLFSGLGTGSYNILVTDATDCETTQSVDILSGVSYANSVKSIIETNCSISGCHDGSISPDLTSFNNIQARAGRIKARTANRSMPRGRTLTQTEIDLIACWVDDGALNN